MGRKGVILAAGKGTRLRPLTDKTPKPLIEVGGRPFLAYVLERFRFAGCDEVLLVIGHLGEQIVRRCGERAFGMQLRYAWQFVPEGTAKALLLAEDFVGDEPFLMSWGDIVAAPENYTVLWQRYGQGDCAMTMLVNWMDDVSAGADVTLDGERVTDIVEKPSGKKAGWNQAGIFVLSPRIFAYLRRVRPSMRGEYEFTDAVRLMLQAGERVIAVPVQGYRYELGTHEQLQALEQIAAQLRLPSE
ncbi:Glucose-1-phosphate thymidylyltransferase 2 [bacterium HR17]|jgi:dTDP-glucose pyrophosphorylase|uniref:Glucose-1-phosphate thymidylyltransferase 2 n=1 Tax=Candidatus Fervidibacter japonicus TaxID=2035412 RepID=A0A2H5XDM4_9BACT|nr:Glucose-1-phosphate thymidylyltransferase 2 [bacterium HR17]